MLTRSQRATARQGDAEWPHGSLVAIGTANRPKEKDGQHVLVGEAARARKIAPLIQASVADEPAEESQPDLRVVPCGHDSFLEQYYGDRRSEEVIRNVPPF